MRNSFLLLAPLLFGAAVAEAAEPPAGFADVKWGASAADIKRVMAQRKVAQLGEETPSTVVFNGGDFANYPAKRWIFELGPRGFWQGTVYLTIPAGNTASGVPLRNRQFDDLAASLSKKYGKPVPQPGGANAAEATWKIADPKSGRKGAFTVFLRYCWEPYEFLIRYSYNPAGEEAASKTPKRKKDL